MTAAWIHRLRLRIRPVNDRLMGDDRNAAAGRCLIGLTYAVFMVTKRSDHQAFASRETEILIAWAEKFCDKEAGPSRLSGRSKRTIRSPDHVLNTVDPRPECARSSWQNEGGRRLENAPAGTR